ncbi:MAG: hypothetical protein II670_02115 [Alphaproteobacteria bacterium]|nr:hypothetical protein [Alphaproteobacteria bacterium]
MKKSILIIIGLIGLIVFREATFAQRQYNWTMHEQEMQQQIRDLNSLCNDVDFD